MLPEEHTWRSGGECSLGCHVGDIDLHHIINHFDFVNDFANHNLTDVNHYFDHFSDHIVAFEHFFDYFDSINFDHRYVDHILIDEQFVFSFFKHKYFIYQLIYFD